MTQYAWMFSITSIILVFIGWRVTFLNAMRIATRSESKSIADSLTKLINELADLSVDYWLRKAPNVPQTPNELKGQFASVESGEFLSVTLAKTTQIAHHFKLLNDRGVLANASRLSGVLEKVTLDCEIANEFTPTDRIVRTNEIISECMEVIEDIYANFQVTYPPSKHLTLSARLKLKVKEIEEWHASMY